MDKYLALKKKSNLIFMEKVPGGDLTTYKTGGIVELCVYPKNKEESIEILKIIKENGFNYFILGEGSNVLISDKGFDGVMLICKNMRNMSILENQIEAECGVLWDMAVEKACQCGLGGLEDTSFIPGSVGGAIRMNAGAFGSETFDHLSFFNAINISEMREERIEKKDIRYGYRFVEGIEKYFILSAVFRLQKKDRFALLSRREEIIKKRKEKQPLEYPSAGSVFKRPKNDYASRLIDSCGLKGLRIGGAMVSVKHAGFIVNYDKATAEDIYRLIVKVKKEVFEKTGIMLEEEQILLGDFSDLT